MKQYGTLAAGYLHTVGLKSDGTVVAAGQNKVGQCDVGGWRSISIKQRKVYRACTIGKDLFR